MRALHRFEATLAFGIYIHIPYCLQLCPYCDFTKYQWGKTLGPEVYTDLVKSEIRNRAQGLLGRPQLHDVTTIYFGGGTPSLLEPSLILSLIDEVANVGFRLGGPNAGPEISIEIDPATVDEARLDAYLENGINRFSVGAQSFNDRLLKLAGRKHTSQDTVELLSLLARRGVNYSFDLLFALPTQTLGEVAQDVQKALDFAPSHLSAYNLTVPKGHRLDAERAPEGEQIAMFDLIEERLAAGGLRRYEISNFAKPGFESKHNSLYWQDQPYWGLGLSSHSYLPASSLLPDEQADAPHGVRFWNRRSMKEYEKEMNSSLSSVSRQVPWSYVTHPAESQRELLREHQALTDFLHTSLRPIEGLSENALRLRFPAASAVQAIRRLGELVSLQWASKTPEGWSLTREGRLVANLAFEKLTFLQGEMN